MATFPVGELANETANQLTGSGVLQATNIDISSSLIVIAVTAAFLIVGAVVFYRRK